MADLTDEQIEQHTLRNGRGESIGVTCINCSRYMDGKTPKLCEDCARAERQDAREAKAESRTAARSAARADAEDKDDDNEE